MNHFENIHSTEQVESVDEKLNGAQPELATRLIANVSRRHFLKSTGIGLGGLVIGMQLPAATLPMKWADEPVKSGVFSPNVYLKIGVDNKVSVIVHRSEMGQGIRTSIPMLIADELEVNWKDIIVEQALADKKYGDQNTDGSRSVRRFYSILREAAAGARMMLEQAAANRWKVSVKECAAKNTSVVHTPSGKTLSYGELVLDSIKLELPPTKEIQLKSNASFEYINQKTHVPLVDGHAIATGKTTFGIDIDIPGMKVAVIARPPVLASHVKSFDATKAKKVKGVVDVVAMDNLVEPALFKPLGGIAVIAENTWAAIKARELLEIEWQWSEHRDHNSDTHKKDMKKSCNDADKVFRNKGDVTSALKSAKKIHQAEYFVPALAHAPMEPPMATAHFEKGRFKIWASTQAPQGAQQTVSQITGVKTENIDLYVTLLGGGFGRKSKADYVVEAAVLAKKLGYPVKVCWMREDDIQQGYYHAESYQQLKGAFDSNGKILAWQHHVSEPPIGSTFQKGADQIGSESNLGLVDVPFEIDHIRCASGKAQAHHRIGWMRSVTNINHAFALCSFADELAFEVKQDPKDFLLSLIGSDRKIDLSKENANYGNYGEDLKQFPLDTQRLKKVIRRAAELAQWDTAKKNNRYLGIAAHRSFVSYVATIVEVSKTSQGKVKLEAIWMVADSGTIVNYERVKSQMEGAAVFGISIALHGEISSLQGEVQQSNFHDYPVARMTDVPKTHVDLIINEHPPGGVGEPGVPPVAPAICNAIFAATGKRFRELPLSKQNIMA